MAEAATPVRAVTTNDSDDPRYKQMMALVERGKRDRSRHQARISDVYKYTMPWRHKFNQSSLDAGMMPDLDVIFDETVGTVLEDFAADMLDTFTPRKNNWLEEQPVGELDVGDRRIIAEALANRQQTVFDNMGRSNLYQALQEAYMDLGPGTMALLVTDMDATQPIHCECIPAPDLIITRGPFGYVDGVFREKKYLRSDIEVLWPQAQMAKLSVAPQDGQAQEFEVIDGCWRDWTNRGTERYHYLVTAESKIIYAKEWSGPGSCPFIVARWSRDSTTAWGMGPTYRTLPAIKTLNHVRYLSLKNYDKYVDPVVSYADDGVMNPDQGIEPGTWVPRAVGSDAPESVESKSKFDVEVFQMDELRSTIKRAHYQDRPEQLGKTPPTATQWADERAERARRMGTPATNLVQELQYPLYRRFVYLLEQRGTLPAVKLGANVVSLQPVSPLLRAQEQEEILRMDRFAELIVKQFGPQLAPIVIDLFPWVKQMAIKFGISTSLLRDEAKIKQAIEQLLPVLQQAAGGGAAPEIPAGLVGPPQ